MQEVGEDFDALSGLELRSWGMNLKRRGESRRENFPFLCDA